MGNANAYRKNMDLIFQEIEEKECLQQQAVDKYRRNYLLKHLPKLIKPWRKHLRRDVPSALIVELARMARQAADLQLESERRKPK